MEGWTEDDRTMDGEENRRSAGCLDAAGNNMDPCLIQKFPNELQTRLDKNTQRGGLI